MLTVFVPRGRSAAGGDARRIVEAALVAEGLSAAAWRTVPVDASALGSEAAAARPAILQALVARPDDAAEASFELALVCARRRADAAAREAGLDGLAVVSASSRTVVYKGLVAGDRLASLFPDLTVPLDLPFALFHQRYATNTQPVWSLAQPFGTLAHNGEINTVRGNREAIRGRLHDAGIPTRRRVAADRLCAAGPLLSPGVSDSRSLDEAVELLMATGWSVESALLALVPEAASLRRAPHPAVAAFRRRVAGFVAPWDGPGAFVFSDGRRVGALLDRNGLRPAAWAVTEDRLVAVASEAGAVPLPEASIVRTGRLAPGELLLVDPAAGRVLTDSDAKSWVLRRLPLHDAPREVFADRDGADDGGGAHDDESPAPASDTPPGLRFLFGLDAERLRLDVRTMALDGHEPLWSMGDDTPLAGRGRVTRAAADHLRQAFAQVTNPPIDPERERAVMDLQMELGRRPPFLGGMPAGAATVRIARPVVVDLAGLLDAVRRQSRSPHRAVRTLDATWNGAEGRAGLEPALDRLAARALEASHAGAEVLVLSDAAASLDGGGRLPIPSVLAAGAVHTALAEAGLRGRTDLVVDTSDVLDVHGLAMAVAAGARVVHPRLLLELVREQAGSRGAEALGPSDAVANAVAALDAGLRKVLARMGISTVASYVGGQLFETIELSPAVVARCFPAAAAWPGRLELGDLAAVQLARLDEARAVAAAARPDRLPDPGLARYRGDGELHLYSPSIAGAVQALAAAEGDTGAALEAYRAALRRDSALVRDGFRVVRRRGAEREVPLDEVEDARSIARRFVVSAMSVGALSPEAHRALTLGIQALGGAANTGEGGEDPAWYAPGPDGSPTDARIKQVASARFGVTAEYLARADQLEIKMAQGSKPGEGGQLPGRKVTAYIAALRRAQPGQALISPPPHHDIYSIEDLAQLIADLRAINPAARIGVKLVATRGVGTIASGVTKAGADYIHLSGHAGGHGRVAAVVDQARRRAVGARRRRGPPGAPPQRPPRPRRPAHGRRHPDRPRPARRRPARGRGVRVRDRRARRRRLRHGAPVPPRHVPHRHRDPARRPAGQVHGHPRDGRRVLPAPGRGPPPLAGGRRRPVRGRGRGRGPPAPARDARQHRRPRRPAAAAVADLARAALGPVDGSAGIGRQPASALETRLVGALRGQDGGLAASGLRVTTAERSMGAAITGAIRRGELRGPVRLGLRGAAGQSFGAWAGEGVSLVLEGTANDYVGKGLSGGHLVVRPGGDRAAGPQAGPVTAFTLAGNTCLYGATSGRLHVVGRAGMRFAIRNSGAEAVVEGVGPHACEYMTGGAVVVLGPVGQSFGAGMTGGRAYLWDPAGRHVAALHAASVRAVRLAEAALTRDDGDRLVAELHRLLVAHRDAGSALAARLVDAGRGARRGRLARRAGARCAGGCGHARRRGGHAGAVPGTRRPDRGATEPQPGRRLTGVAAEAVVARTMHLRRTNACRRSRIRSRSALEPVPCPHRTGGSPR